MKKGYRFDLKKTKWKGYRSFPHHKILREYLPANYSKLALELCDFNFDTGYVWAVANGRRYNPEIETALSWLALENILGKLLKR